jgi:hypothetical protein
MPNDRDNILSALHEKELKVREIMRRANRQLYDGKAEIIVRPNKQH